MNATTKQFPKEHGSATWIFERSTARLWNDIFFNAQHGIWQSAQNEKNMLEWNGMGKPLEFPRSMQPL
jgi:hypothetical protein